MEGDKHGMHGILRGYPEQCEEALSLGRNIKVNGVKDIIHTGIGGSSFPGDVLRDLLLGEREVFVNKNYTIPHPITSESLVLASSFSGNTEETLEATEQALEKGAKILGICKGGKLEKLSNKHGFPCIIVPDKGEVETRAALGYMIIPLLNALHKSGITEIREQDVKEGIEALKDHSLEQRGKELAAQLAGKIPVIYTPIELSCIGTGWAKQRLNETAKVPAFSNNFPNLTHDELSMYQKPQPHLHALFFIDQDGNPKTRRRMELSLERVKEKSPATLIPLDGPLFTKIFTALHLGDWVAYYLALARGVDPTEVPMQTDIKNIMQGNAL